MKGQVVQARMRGKTRRMGGFPSEPVLSALLLWMRNAAAILDEYTACIYKNATFRDSDVNVGLPKHKCPHTTLELAGSDLRAAMQTK